MNMLTSIIISVLAFPFGFYCAKKNKDFLFLVTIIAYMTIAAIFKW